MLTLLGAGQGQNTNYILDLYSGASVAYSLRKLKSTTTNVVRVRRSSDNAEQDFRASQITDGTLIIFCGSGDGFVTVWYDQSSNNLNITQNSASRQPKIVNAGSLILNNSKPSILFDSIDDSLFSNITQLSQPFSIFSVIKDLTPTDNTNRWYFNGGSNPIVLGKGLNKYSCYAGSSFISSLNVSPNLALNFWQINNTNSKFKLNNNILETGTTGTRPINIIRIGNLEDTTSSNWNGSVSEFILYNSSSVDVDGISTNINNNYTIY